LLAAPDGCMIALTLSCDIVNYSLSKKCQINN